MMLVAVVFLSCCVLSCTFKYNAAQSSYSTRFVLQPCSAVCYREDLVPPPCFCLHSAGVGRTGTFIVIDSMIDMMHMEQRLDVFGFVSRIREQRCQLIQTDVSIDPFRPAVPWTDSSTRCCSGRGVNKRGDMENNRGCDAKNSRKQFGKLQVLLPCFPLSSSSDAVLLHLPGSVGVLPVWRHRARCVLSGGPSAEASQHKGSPRQAGPGGGVQGTKKGAPS